MTHSATLDPLSALPRAPASDVKKHGWRGIMRAVSERGKVLITNHDTPEAVILSTREYAALVQAAQAASVDPVDPLQALRRRFDERLAALAEDDAGDRLRALMDKPVRLEGKVRAGPGY